MTPRNSLPGSPWMMTTCLSLLLLGFGSCGIEETIGVQSGIFTCDTSSQCPDEMFCDNYFNTYIYFTEVRAQPVSEGRWGYCNHDGEMIRVDGLPVEDCANGLDDDEDGGADCLDLECQTAPGCRTRIAQECAEGEAGELCDGRLGFPSARGGSAVGEANCPGQVGLIHTNDGGTTTFCLPRCRLYFPDVQGTTANSAEEDFAGSDTYCNAVAPMYGTIPSFSGGPLRCQHLGTVDRGGSVIQEDACLPETSDLVLESPEGSPPVETCQSVCGGSDCLKVSYKRRVWTAIEGFSFSGDTVMIGTEPPGNDPALYLQTAFYCLD